MGVARLVRRARHRPTATPLALATVRPRSQHPRLDHGIRADGAPPYPGARPGRLRRQPVASAPATAGVTDASPSDDTAEAAEKVIETMSASDQAADVTAVRDAAVDFVRGVTEAFGFETTVDAAVDGSEIRGSGG